MNTKLTIYKNENDKSQNFYTLDLSDDISIPLTYSIVDFRNPEKRKTDISKTIKIPGTPKNNKVLGLLFEIGVNGSSQGINRKVHAVVTQDGYQIFTGSLQITNIKVQGGDKFSYDGTLLGSLGDFFSAINIPEDGATASFQYLEDLDLSEYDHLINRKNIIDSWYGSNYLNGTPGGTSNVIYGTAKTFNRVIENNGLAQLQFTGAHGLAVGDFVEVIGTSAGSKNSGAGASGSQTRSPGPSAGNFGSGGYANRLTGYAVVTEIVDSTHAVIGVPYDPECQTPNWVGTGASGNVFKTTYTGKGYVYPMVDHGYYQGVTAGATGGAYYSRRPGDEYLVNDFKPAIYVKTLVDKIAEGAGYRIDSSFMEGQFFKRLIVPFSSDTWPLGSTAIAAREFLAGSTSLSGATFSGYSQAPSFYTLGTIISPPSISLSMNAANTYDPAENVDLIAEYAPPIVELGATDINAIVAGNHIDLGMVDSASDLAFTDVTNAPYFNNGGYNNTSMRFTAPDAGYYNFECNVNFEINRLVPGSNTGGRMYIAVNDAGHRVFENNNIKDSYVMCIYLVDPTDGRIYASSFTKSFDMDSSGPDGSGTPYFNYQGGCSMKASKIWVNAGTQLNMKFAFWGRRRVPYSNIQFPPGAGYPSGAGSPGDAASIGGSIWSPFYMMFKSGGSFAATVADPQYYEGNVTNLTASLPSKYKMVDFFTTLLRMFNLYVTVDQTDSHLLHIETRDTFYSNSEIEDWTHKLDLSKDIDINPLAELQALRYKYTHKTDSDYFNDKYNKKFAEPYATKNINVDNEYVKGEYKTETNMSPSPIVLFPDPGDRAITQIVKKTINQDKPDTNASTGANLRIMFFGNRGTQYNFSIANFNNNFVTEPAKGWVFRSDSSYDQLYMVTYPYAGPLDNPLYPTYSLDFGDPREVYYPANYRTLNNLYNVYHQSYIDEISGDNARVMTCYVYLTAKDIFRLDFSKMYRINGTLFRLNKLNYNPNAPGPSKCEFLKIKQII